MMHGHAAAAPTTAVLPLKNRRRESFLTGPASLQPRYIVFHNVPRLVATKAIHVADNITAPPRAVKYHFAQKNKESGQPQVSGYNFNNFITGFSMRSGA
jgi:hypothetical protein